MACWVPPLAPRKVNKTGGMEIELEVEKAAHMVVNVAAVVDAAFVG